jgi:hypothetical protein
MYRCRSAANDQLKSVFEDHRQKPDPRKQQIRVQDFEFDRQRPGKSETSLELFCEQPTSTL